MRWSMAALAASLALPASARAGASACDSLPGGAREVADGVLAASYAYDCCDETLAVCLKAIPPCRLVVRLAEDVCRRAKAGQSAADITRALQKRAVSMTPGARKADIATDEAMAAGDVKAPVVVVEYACARCPYCRQLTPALHHEVVAGRLRGKVRLYFRPFPIRGHEGSVEAGTAFVAAARVGGFWPFALKVYGKDEFASFEVAKLPVWAAQAGLARADFERAYADPATREALVAAKKEGLHNSVDSTPTLFIGGRKYVHDMDLDVLVDVLEEEYERVTPAAPPM